MESIWIVIILAFIFIVVTFGIAISALSRTFNDDPKAIFSIDIATRDLLVDPVLGLTIFNTDSDRFNVFNGMDWEVYNTDKMEEI